METPTPCRSCWEVPGEREVLYGSLLTLLLSIHGVEQMHEVIYECSKDPKENSE